MGNAESREFTEEERTASIQRGYDKASQRFREIEDAEFVARQHRESERVTREEAERAATRQSEENAKSEAAEADRVKAKQAAIDNVKAEIAGVDRPIAEKAAKGELAERKAEEKDAQKAMLQRAAQDLAAARKAIDSSNAQTIASINTPSTVNAVEADARTEKQAEEKEKFSRSPADDLTSLHTNINQTHSPESQPVSNSTSSSPPSPSATLLAAWHPRKERKDLKSIKPTNRESPAESDDDNLFVMGGSSRRRPSDSTRYFSTADAPVNNLGGGTQAAGASKAPVQTALSTKRPFANFKGIPRIPKKQRTSMSASESPRSPVSTANSDIQPPEWLRRYTFGKYSSIQNESKSITDSLKATITKAKNSEISIKDASTLLRDKIHKLFFIKVDEQTVRNNGMLKNDSGLPQVFHEKYAAGLDWPYDVKADAEELYNKWSDRIFETDLLRDINAGKPKDAYEEGADERGSSVMDGKRVSSKYFGQGKLLNGQWWPTLLCAFRDGAHGETIAGISGDAGIGAYSCFISGGGGSSEYPDIDNGDTVEYCGTDDKTRTGTITRGTQMMLDSMDKDQPVRFIRSSKAKEKSRYAPDYGFRYDGLYDIQGVEILDASMARHRFRLVRRPGQGQIRGGNGPEARPTREEVDAYLKDKRLRGFKP